MYTPSAPVILLSFSKSSTDGVQVLDQPDARRQLCTASPGCPGLCHTGPLYIVPAYRLHTQNCDTHVTLFLTPAITALLLPIFLKRRFRFCSSDIKWANNSHSKAPRSGLDVVCSTDVLFLLLSRDCALNHSSHMVVTEF